MNQLLMYAIAFITIGVLIAAFTQATAPAEYTAKPLMTPPELRLHSRLADALPDYLILPQVALPALVAIEASRQERLRHWNAIRAKYVDFVVCHKDFRVVAVIELDDKSHERPDRRKADREKDNALEAAGYRVIRWTVKNMPDRFEIARQFNLSH